MNDSAPKASLVTLDSLALHSRIAEHSAAGVSNALLAGSEVLRVTAHCLSDDILRAGTLLCSAIAEGRQVLACGNGGSASDAQHFVAELVGRYRSDRTAWRAISLAVDPSVVTSIANDFGFVEVFARQIAAHGRAGDISVALSTSGTSPNILRAAETARQGGLHVIALTGARKSKLSELAHITLNVPSLDTPLIQQAHIAIIHALCDLLETRFCG